MNSGTALVRRANPQQARWQEDVKRTLAGIAVALSRLCDTSAGRPASPAKEASQMAQYGFTSLGKEDGHSLRDTPFAASLARL